jgi:glucoamylase
VVASPSTEDPNYYYSWIRDSSLVFKVLVDIYTHGKNDSLQGLIDAFAASQGQIQQVTDPSGSILTGGLGEPKFYVNEVGPHLVILTPFSVLRLDTDQLRGFLGTPTT